MKTIIAILLSLVLALPAWGADITRSITFTDGSRLTAAQLHTLIDGATVSTTFYTGKDTETALGGGDYFLVYSPTYTGFRKITATAALYNNTALITGATEKSAPTAADYLLLYDATGLQLAKTSIGSLQSNITYTLSFTNLAFHSTPTNNDKLLIFSSQYGSNRVASLASLVTNLPALGWGTNSATNYIQLTNADQIPIFSTVVTTNGVSNVLSKVTVGQLAAYVASNTVALAYDSTNYPIPTAAGVITNIHNLNKLPIVLRALVVCVTNEFGFISGDEVNFESVLVVGAYVGPATVACNTNNFYFMSDGNTSYGLRRKDTGALATMTKNNWRLKFRASFNP